MLEHIVNFTAWPIFTGIFIGYIANRIMSGEGKGCCMNLFVGVVGSYVGAFISNLLDYELLGRGYIFQSLSSYLSTAIAISFTFYHYISAQTFVIAGRIVYLCGCIQS